VLDGFAKNGSGKTFPNFSGKGYNSIFHAMLGMLHNIQKDPYHGTKLQAQLMECVTTMSNSGSYPVTLVSSQHYGPTPVAQHLLWSRSHS